MTKPDSIPVCMSIAGSDSGGGAGIQADLRAFQYFGTFGVTVLTAVTAQDTTKITKVDPLGVDTVIAQYEVLEAAYDVVAIKTGMLAADDTIAALCASLAGRPPGVMLVVDPVVEATDGTPLVGEQSMELVRERLLPLATLVTPNLPEACGFMDRQAAEVSECRDLAFSMAEMVGTSVLLTGGHSGGDTANDILVSEGTVYDIESPRVISEAGHGTGCSLSAAVTANLALGLSLVDAVVAAKAYVYHSLINCRCVGPGAPVLLPPATLDASVIQVSSS